MMMMVKEGVESMQGY